MERWQAAIIDSGDVVDTAGALAALACPDGPGYYVIRRATCRHRAGAAAATYQLKVYDDYTAGAVSNPERLAFVANGTTVIATNYTWPLATDTPALPGRLAYTETGNLQIDFGANVVGDTYRVSLIVQRVR